MNADLDSFQFLQLTKDSETISGAKRNPNQSLLTKARRIIHWEDMAKLRELQVDYEKKTFLRGNDQIRYRGIFVWIQTIVQYVVWFLLLPWTFFVTALFPKKTRHRMKLECNESTKEGQKKQVSGVSQ